MALFVLIVGFLGILSLLAQSIFLSRTVSNETTATYLASEGIEIAKNLIDHDVYEHLAGLGTGWGNCFGTGGNFEFDITTTDCGSLVKVADQSELDFLYYDPMSHVYVYAANDAVGQPRVTGYTRMVKVTPNPNAAIPEITINSIVYWNVGQANQQSVNLEDQFYNWHP